MNDLISRPLVAASASQRGVALLGPSGESSSISIKEARSETEGDICRG